MQRALIANNNLLEAKILADNLAQDGFAATIAHTGLEAWVYLKKDDSIKIILIDAQIANMEYEELINKIKKDKRLRDIPIIFIEGEKESLEEFEESRPPDVFFSLTKPVERILLRSIINSAVSDFEHADAPIGSW